MVWAALVTSVLLHQGAAGPQPASHAPSSTPAQLSEPALLDSLEAAELRFFHEWGRLWRASELSRHLVVGQFEVPRIGTTFQRDGNVAALPSASPQAYQRVREDNLRCMKGGRLWEPTRMIASDAGPFGACPSWLLGDAEAADERLGIDGALNTEYRAAARAARRSLADMFVAASAQFPRNDWIVGQAVRLLVDAQSFGAAQSAAAACAATRWWCDALTGYALGARGETVAAEQAFVAALEQMPREMRCRWTDFGVLLDSLARASYARVPCEQRDSTNRALWWLADPLYSVPGNARLVEHFSRHTRVALHAALDRDERYDWRPALGGDALAQMIVRYGWPSYTFWGGEIDERGINNIVADAPTGFKKTYTTFEYSAGRVQLVPSWSAARDPLSATAADWTLRDPAPPANPNDSDWWPREHVAMPLVQLGEMQLVMLRRESSVLIASAVDLDTAFARRAGGDVRSGALVSGALLMTDGPDSVDVIARGGARAGSTLVLRGTAAPRPALLGVELAGDAAAGVAAARTRFAVTPPATLAAMRPGDVAISEPVVLREQSGAAAPPLDADSALALMLGSTRIASGAKIGVYWESYGFQPTDTVTVALWIERYTQQHFMRQLGIAFRVATDLNTPVANTWDEAGPTQGTRVIAGPVPVISRHVVLDISKLPKGDYWLEVAVGKRGEAPVRARRTVTIQ